MSDENESDLVSSLEWAYATLKSKLTFGLPEEYAIKRREARVRGVLPDAIKEVKELEQENKELKELVKEAISIIDNMRESKCPHEMINIDIDARYFLANPKVKRIMERGDERER